MIKCINKITGIAYEAIQYTGKTIEVINTIKKYINIPIRVVKPKMFTIGLVSPEIETEINIGDWIIKTVTDGEPLFDVISDEIMNSNFEIMTLINKANKAIEEAKTGKYILIDKKDNKQYKYGDNPYYDMQIGNCLFVDMFPEEIKENDNFYGCKRSNYIINQIA